MKHLRSLHMVFLSYSSQYKECLNKPNLLQRWLGKFARNTRMSFRQLLPATCNAIFTTCWSNATKSVLWKAAKKVSNTKENWRLRDQSQNKQTFLQFFVYLHETMEFKKTSQLHLIYTRGKKKPEGTQYSFTQQTQFYLNKLCSSLPVSILMFFIIS